MSSKIDERVVAMKINHEQFMKGTTESISALDSLKKALNFDGATKSLDQLDSTGKKLNFAGMGSGIDEAASRFSNLQVVALGALATIGAKAVELGISLAQNLGQSLTKDIQAGFSDYNTKLTSVQTIMNATGEDIEVVNSYFKTLDTYADKTVYNLQDMTSAFAKFTNAGVDMDVSVPAIQGIANMVALAGQGANEASIAMYNLSQSIGGGFLTTTDFKSLNLANVATKEWKEQMIAGAVAAGTLRDEGGGVYSIMADGSEKAATAQSLFTEELSRGWASTSVLLDVLGDYGDLSTDIGKKAFAAAQNVKSIPMMFETLSAAAGTGWTDTFELLLGNVTEATSLFTYLTGEIGGFTAESAAARNEQLKFWKEQGGRDAIIEALHNAFEALESVMGPIKRAFAEVFPPSLGKTLLELSNGIRDFTKGLILSETAQKNLQMVATAFFQVLKFGVDIIGGIGKVLGFLIGLAFDLGGAIFGLISPILTFVRSFIPVKEGAEDTTSAISGFFDMLVGAGKFLTGWIITGLNALGEGFNNLLNNGVAVQRVKELQDGLKGLADTVMMMWNVLTKGDFTANPFFAEDSALVDTLFKIREGIVTVVDAFKTLGDGVADAAGKAQTFWGGISNIVATVWGYIKPIAAEVGKFFDSIMSGMDLDTVMAGVNAGVLVALAVGVGKMVKKFLDAFSTVGDISKSFIGALDELGGALSRFGQETPADKLIKVAGALILLAGALYIISQIDPNRLVSSVTAMATSFGIMLGGLALLDKINAEPSMKASVALSLIAVAVNILASAVAKMGALDAEQLKNGLLGIAIAMGILIVAAQQLDGLEGSLVKSAAGMILMATAITIMAGAVALFGVMPMDVLIQGFIAVTAVMALLVGAAVILSKFAPQMVMAAVGLMAMAAALNMLVLPITLLGLLPFAVLLQGMLALGIILAGLVIAANLLAGIAPQMALAAVGMMAMAFALNMMVAPITILGMLPLETLIIGLAALAAMLAILVIATNAMTTAMPGAIAMIAVAGALLILSVALAVMAGIGLEGIIVAILGLVAAVLAMAVISAILTPLIPVMAGVAGVMALFALGMLALAAAMLVGVVAIGMLGPALLMAIGGIVAFAKAGDMVVAAAGPMALLGAALIAFGAGALIAGVGALVLGAGLLVLGAGLALVGAVGILGAVALAKVVENITGLMVHIPGMLAMGAAFLALGAGVAILGAGLLVLGAGAILTGVALMMLIPLGALVTLSINMIITALTRLAPMSEQVSSISSSLGKLGDAVAKLAANGRAASSGLLAISNSFTGLTLSAGMAGMSMTKMGVQIRTSMTSIQGSLKTGAMSFTTFGLAVVLTVATMNAGLKTGFKTAENSAKGVGTTIGNTLISGIKGSYGGVFAASVTLGGQMTAGMNVGLQNGSWSVSQMASRVAQNALTAAKNTLGVASPSKEFEKVGKWSAQGLANGLKKNTHVVEKASSDAGKAALKATKKALTPKRNPLAQTDMVYHPYIKPVLDLTHVKKEAKKLNGMMETKKKAPTLSVTNNLKRARYLSNARKTTEDQRAEQLEGSKSKPSVVFNQYNSSPKALSQAEIYRNTNNAISVIKKGAPV